MNVRALLYHKRVRNDEIRSLVATLGADTSQRSWAKVCRGRLPRPERLDPRCAPRQGAGVQQDRQTGGQFITDLTYVSSANLTGSNSVDSWNNSTVIPSDPIIAKAATA